jgi:hypothetical protein
MTQAALKYDEACRAVAVAKSFDEVRDWEDKAAAVREYSRRIRNRSLEIDALEIRERARRRRGELLIHLRENGQLLDGRTKTVTDEVPFQRVTLDDLDVSKNESSRDQKIAALDGNSFERLVARCRAYMEDNPDKHAVDVLRVKDGPINGARSIMGSRQEPDDSLDFFPTPPWATRALMEVVLPQLGVRKFGSAWEPACGEGHIAEVLGEYFGRVLATDIVNYGYSGELFDFIEGDPVDYERRDWIITNPPFKERAEAFVLRSLDLANVGVAMFLRLQWLETNGRYERIFHPFPPTMIAQFAERVPLCKGQWDPKGDTATAYLWIVWIPEYMPRSYTRFFWVPPGQRESLTRPDDAERFTAHPVIKRNRPRDASGTTLNHDADGVVREAAE